MSVRSYTPAMKGRGSHQVCGVNHSCGDILLFLHGDTILPENYFENVLITLGTPGVVAGAFYFDVDILHSESNPPSKMFSWTFKLIRWGTNIQSEWFEFPYGNQALFLTRNMLDKVGGYPCIPLMDDYQFVKTLRKEGHVKMTDGSVLTSAVRWEKYGFLNTIRSFLIIAAFNLGVKPTTLAKWYYFKGKTKKT